MTGERKLWGFPPSPPVRAVLLTLKALNLDFTFEIVNTLAEEHKKPEFLQKNPQHTIPVLEEPDGTCLWDSHAICAYLVRKYGKDDSLYPKDFYQRAIVDQRLHFENGVVFASCIRSTFAPIVRGTVTIEEFQEKIVKIKEVYDLLEVFLTGNKYVAGKGLTIADFSLVSSISSMDVIVPIESSKWPNVATWLERMSKLPYYAETNGTGIQIIEDMLKDKLENLRK